MTFITISVYGFQLWTFSKNYIIKNRPIQHLQSDLSSINNLFLNEVSGSVNTGAGDPISCFSFWIQSVKIFSTSHRHAFTYILSSKTERRGYHHYWVGAVSRRAKLHEIYLHTHAARLNHLEVKEVGLHSPRRAAARLRTPTAEEKTIYLF